MPNANYNAQFNRGSLRLSGDWQRARKTFHGLGFKMNKVTHGRTMREEAELVAARIKRNIKNQTYASEGRHAPLAESTKENKKNPSNRDKILLDTEEFVNSIGVFQNGYRTWVVGVQGDGELLARVMANEFGAPSRHLPARSTFRIEMERIKAEGRLEKLDKAFKNLLKGKHVP